MSSADVVNADQGDWPPISPQRLLAIAGGAAVGAVIAVWLPWDFPLVLCMLTALLTAGGAVVLRPRSPAVLCAAAGIAFLMALQMRPAWDLSWLIGPRPIVNQPNPAAWDSARVVVVALGVLAVLAAAMVSLPSAVAGLYVRRVHPSDKKAPELRERGEWLGRQLSRAIVSVFVVLHFTGISCAFLSVPPPGRDQSWLAQWGWTLAQPYLQFMYLVNAYRFYSPEPAAASILWFYIEYADGEVRELKIPNREEHQPDPLGQEYTRRLTITEATNRLVPLGGIPDSVLHRRITWGDPKYNPALTRPFPLRPTTNYYPIDLQYRLPSEEARRLLGQYARHMALKYSQSDKGAKVVSMKIYRVTHRMLDPWEMARPENDPAAEWTYMPYYQGEFVAPSLRPGHEDEDAEQGWVLKDPNDPFLYWLIPIWAERQPIIDPNKPEAPPGSLGYTIRIENCMKEHTRLKTKQGGAKP